MVRIVFRWLVFPPLDSFLTSPTTFSMLRRLTTIKERSKSDFSYEWLWVKYVGAMMGVKDLKKCPFPPPPFPISSKLSLSQISTTYYISKEELPKKALKGRDISSLKWLQICSFLWGFNVAEAKFFRQNSSLFLLRRIVGQFQHHYFLSFYWR